MDSVDLTILGLGFSPVWIAVLFFLVCEARKRLTRPQPIISLVCDLLDVGSGWLVGPNTIRHHTGVLISLGFDTLSFGSGVQAVRVDGSIVPLRPADRFCVDRSIATLKKRRQADSDAEAAALLKRRAQEFAQRVERFADSKRTGA